MMKPTNTSLHEDYWYSNETCKTNRGQDVYRCEEIYFKKNTGISARYATRIGIPFIVPSTGKSIDNYFKAVPKD